MRFAAAFFIVHHVIFENPIFLLVICSVAPDLVASAPHVHERNEASKQCHGEKTRAQHSSETNGVLATEADENLQLSQELVDWIRAHHGYVNPKLEIRRERPGDKSSILGVFATERIEDNELLGSIPWKLMVKPPDKLFEASEKDGRNILQDDSVWCEGIYAMIREMRLVDESDATPYARYLSAQPPRVLPAEWSGAGRKLLAEILGGHLPPHDIDYNVEFWRDVCEGSSRKDPFEEDVAMLVQARAEDLLMVPFYDMFNHRNGHWLNTKVEYANNVGTPFEILASRTIEAGEQVYNSYNMCSKCEGRSESREYGTPEILRDYGFVEQMPQRWMLGDGRTAIKFDLEEDIETGRLGVVWAVAPPTVDELRYLREEKERLANFSPAELQRLACESGATDSEMNVIGQYHDALTVAIGRAIDVAEEETSRALAKMRSMKEIEIKDELRSSGTDFSDTADKEVLVQLLLHARTNRENNATGIQTGTCKEFLNQDGYVVVGKEQSIYQSILFEEHPFKPDMCMTLDETLQICSCYRPHYHEPFVHFPAAYLRSPLRRVAFVGGGDSMLLHEILKYPTIELVLGLELDQRVVRSSFKNFDTQPHFDDERVHWWFGDAAKSLQLLPRDLFGSFDLVLVDLSETIMSVSVTDDLDIFGALVLMLRPEGIFVKNEFHVGLDKMNELFDHAIQLRMLDVPMLCHQDWVMGSNLVNFLTPPDLQLLKNYSVETLFYQPIVDLHDHFGLIESYANDERRSGEKCNVESSTNGDDAGKSKEKGRYGVIMVVEVEDARAPLQPVARIEATLSSVLENVGGVTVLSSVSSSSDHHAGRVAVVIVLREGIVSAHTWPDHNYCALDIQLWGAFEKQEVIRAAILDALGVGRLGRSWSSFRVVTGGMLGSNTWEKDTRAIGPPLVQQSRHNCRSGDSNQGEAGFADKKTILSPVIQESLNLIADDTISAAVICSHHRHGGECRSLDALKTASGVSTLLVVWTCSPERSDDLPFNPDDSSNDGIIHHSLCNGWEGASEFLKNYRDLHAIFIDPGTTTSVVDDAAYAICSIQESALHHMLFLAPTLDDDPNDLTRRKFFAVCLEKLQIYPKHRVDITWDGSTSEIGIVSSGNPDFLLLLTQFTTNLNNRSDMNSVVKRVKTTHPSFQNDHDALHFTLNDYDRRPALEQFIAQQPLGHQSIFGYDVVRGLEVEVSMIGLMAALKSAISKLTFDESRVKDFRAVGDGALLVAVLREGHVIVVWDGRTHVQLNIFTHGDTVNHKREIADPFLENIPTARMVQHDEQPRGVGRVVNFSKDINAVPGCGDLSESCNVFDSCTPPQIRKWAEMNCMKTCGWCSASAS